MRIITHHDAIEAVAAYICSTALPVGAPEPLRQQVHAQWRHALAAAPDGFDASFVLVSQVAARGSRVWAAHRETGMVFTGVPGADLVWLEDARAKVEAFTRR
ncbi:hypothetical protein [Nocardioides pakistanensis]